MSAPPSTIASLLLMLLLLSLSLAALAAAGETHPWDRAPPWSPNPFDDVDGDEASSSGAPRHHASRTKGDRIIGGSNAPSGRYPYSISLQKGGHFCGGSLIATDVVFTAAHCVGGPFSVRVGSDSNRSGERIKTKRVVIHPKYDDDSDEFDMALVFLDRSVTSADGIDPETDLVRVNSEKGFPPAGVRVAAIGWGDIDPSDDTSKYPIRMQSVELVTIGNDECEAARRGGDSYRGFIFDSMLCTWTDGKDACQGDSGGPLVVRGSSSSEDVLVGITSWGVGCAFMPGVFSRISEAYDWVEDQVCRRSQDPPYSICPSLSPTTAEPTMSPTENPTDSPTTSSAPTGSPSASPTVSFAPTSRPSDSPTVSASPTAVPSGSPTASSRPSSQPSASPTSQPSGSPTASSMPSSQPSASPTSQPSGSPTARPSMQPSSQPSSQPSMRPSTSSRPSSRPSAGPSGRPSASPSSSPSASASPTSRPSLSPTSTPSDPPTATTAPTASGEPTVSPAPTGRPVDEETIPFLDFGDALLAADQVRSSNTAGEIKNSSDGMGPGHFVGTLLCGVVAAWMVL